MVAGTPGQDDRVRQAPPRSTTGGEGGLLSRPLAWLARWGLGLPGKLLLLTAAFVMLAEVLIFVPSVANFRVKWLQDRLTAAELAAYAAEAVPDGAVPAALREDLLRTAQVKAVAAKRKGQRRLLLSADGPMSVDDHYDLRAMDRGGVLGNMRHGLGLIGDALAVFVAPEGRTIRVFGGGGPESSDLIEIVLPESPLRQAMVRYAVNILLLSIAISLITAALVYVALLGLIVRPMMRLTRNMVHFSQNPQDASRIIAPSSRTDEVGTAERELAHMQGELSHLLLQKSRLAELGLAVSKINHDLRNMLANAQLLSDRLTAIPDPSVQRFAPKLIASLDRAIALCNSTLKYGRAEEAAPRRSLVPLRGIAEEVGEGLGLAQNGRIAFRVDVAPSLRIDADPDHLVRILNNLVRNAVQAIEGREGAAGGAITLSASRANRRTIVRVADTGPGIPPAVRANLFKAFQGSTRKGGSGLGLAIAAELAQAHGGSLSLEDTPSGATFRLEIPDRGAR